MIHYQRGPLAENCLQPLICPICDHALIRINRSLQCAKGHSFDLAREGYVNLLPAGRKRPKFLGDAREMLQARRNFLERGYYAPLAQAVYTRLWPYLATRLNNDWPLYIAELGCGEGYYLGQLKEFLGDQARPAICCLGLDISKEAVRLAARRYKKIGFVVADIKQKLPFAAGSIDLLLNIFAPRHGPEFERVLAQAGLLLIVIPAPDHLLNLPSTLKPLGMEADKQQRIVEQLGGLFRLIGEQALTYEMQLDGDGLHQLIQMTPHYRHLSPEQLAEAERITSLPVQASFTILLFSR